MPAQTTEHPAVRLLRALGDPIRLRLLGELPGEEAGEVSVGQLARREPRTRPRELTRPGPGISLEQPSSSENGICSKQHSRDPDRATGALTRPRHGR